jgi:hypothetical protein
MFVYPQQKKLTYELIFFLTQHFKLEQKFLRGPTFGKEIESWNENLHLGVSTRSYCGANRFVANENVFPAPNHTSLCFVVFLSLLLLQLSTVDSAAPILQHFVTRFSIKGLFKSAWCICSGSERRLCSLCFLFQVSDQQR